MMIGYQNPNGLDFYNGMMGIKRDFVVYKVVMFCAERLQTFAKLPIWSFDYI